jgi:tRNA pseudouridine-54 N-methylase
MQTAAPHRNVVILSHNVSQDVADGLFEVNNLLHGRVDVLARCANAALWVSNGIRKDTTVFLMLFPHNITIEIQGASVRSLNPNERTMALYLQRTLLIGNSNHRSEKDDDNSDDDEKGPQQSLASEERRAVELVRLTTGRTQDDPDAIVNPAKPGSRSKAQKKVLRIARKERQAAVRRLNGFSPGDEAPAGFYFHRNETLGARLEALETEGPILMLHELGDPLWEVLQEQQDDGRTTRPSATTLVLANQMGYAASDEEMLAQKSSGGSLRQVSLGPLSLLTSQCITIAHHYLDLL